MSEPQFFDIPNMKGIFNSYSATIPNKPLIYKIPATYLQNLSSENMIIDSCSNIILQARNKHVRVNNKMGIGLDPSSAYSLHVSGATCISGNITSSGNILPLRDISSDLGSGTKRWRNIFVNDLSVSRINGEAYSTGGTAINLTSVSGNIIPSTNNTFKLGDVSRNWSNAYIRDISATSIEISGNIVPLNNSSSDLGSLTKRFNNIFTNDLGVNTINGQAYSSLVTSKNTINLNFPATGLTSIKQSIIYTTPITLTKNNIRAQIDNVANIKQVYTFGQSISNRWVAVGEGTNSIAYSSDGITWYPSSNGNSILPTSGRSVAYNGTMWVAVGQGATYSIA